MIKKYIRAAVVALVMCSAFLACSKNELDKVDVLGEWKLEEFAGIDAKAGSVEVYINFCPNNSFEIFQKLGEGHFDYFNGTYSVSSSKLSGTYSDGKSWASDYTVQLKDGKLHMTANTEAKSELCVYSACTIPQSVRDDASTYMQTRSSVSELWL